MGNSASHSIVSESPINTDLRKNDFKAEPDQIKISLRIDLWQEMINQQFPESRIEVALVDRNSSTKVRVHVIVPSSISPHDEDLTGKLIEIFGALAHRTNTTRWDIQTPVAFMAVREEGRTWEIEIKNRPSIELKDFWEIVFSPEEMEWQKGIEENVSSGALLRESFRNNTIIECRYRIVAAAAITLLVSKEAAESSSKLPAVAFNDEQISLLEPLASKWLSGQALPDEIARPLVVSDNWRDFVAKGEVVPEEPKWVTAAHKAREAVSEASTFFARKDSLSSAVEISKLVQSVFSNFA